MLQETARWMLDHNQALLQQYRSLAVSMQTLLIALGLAFFTYFTTGAISAFHATLSIFYIALVVTGLIVTVALGRACWIRANYVDALQNILVAIDLGQLGRGDDAPLFAIFRTLRNEERAFTAHEKIYAICDDARKNSRKLRNRFTRFAMSWVVFAMFYGVWIFFGVHAVTVLIK